MYGLDTPTIHPRPPRATLIEECGEGAELVVAVGATCGRTQVLWNVVPRDQCGLTLSYFFCLVQRRSGERSFTGSSSALSTGLCSCQKFLSKGEKNSTPPCWRPVADPFWWDSGCPGRVSYWVAKNPRADGLALLVLEPSASMPVHYIHCIVQFTYISYRMHVCRVYKYKIYRYLSSCNLYTYIPCCCVNIVQ